MVKNLPINAEDTRDKGSIPGSEDPLGKEMVTITYNLSVAVLSQNNIKEVNNAFYHLLMLSLGFPGGSVNKESTCNARDQLQCRRPEFDPWIRKIPWR